MMKKKLLAAALALTMLLGVMPGTAFAADNVEISTLDELKEFRDAVNGGDDYHDKTVTLTADIDLGGSAADPWTPIGTGNYTSFKGTFDGGRHKITGLYIYNTAGDQTADEQGLFGFVGAGGKVQNLSVSGTLTSGRYVGGVVGKNYGVVTGCCYTGEVTGDRYVGGVVGYNDSNCTVEKCYNTGKVTGTISLVGGVVGQSYGPVKNCYNTGAVTGTETFVGGVVGENNNIVENCYNTGTVTGTENETGGVVGYEGTRVTSCYFLAGKGPEHGIGNNASSAEGITADAFKEQSTFLDWDFGSVWTMSAERPTLKDNPEPKPPHSHPVCGATCSGHAPSHENVEWKPLTQADFTNKTNGVTFTDASSTTRYYTLAEGNYYLAENIIISPNSNAYVNIPDNTTVNLCLNGKKLSDSRDSYIPNYFLDVDGTLNLCNCADEGGEVETMSARNCIQIGGSEVTVNLYNVKVICKKGLGISNSGTLTVSGGEVRGGSGSIGISSTDSDAKLTLIGSPKISGPLEDLHIKTADGTTLENANVDATHYTGETLRVKEFDQWGDLTDEKIGAYAIKGGGEGKFTLINECYKYVYENGGMVIRGNHTLSEEYETNESQHWKTCSVCHTETGKADHTPGDWIIDQPATVEAEGSKHKECTVCHYTTATETIPKLEEPDPGPDPDDPTYSISGTVTGSGDAAVSGAVVKLMQGSKQIGEDATTDADGKYNFPGVPAGTYNVVAEQRSGGDKITKTILVVLTNKNSTDNKIQMPDGKKNSVVEVKPNTPAVVVGGVDQVAEGQTVSAGQTVTVKLTVEKKEESAVADAAAAIKQVAGSKTVEFLDLSLLKTVVNGGTTTNDPITDTGNKVLEIVVPYDFTNKTEVTVYRKHGSEAAAALREASTGEKGTFKLDTTNGLIYIYATKFSTYAIGYSESGGSTPTPTPPVTPVTPPVSDNSGSSGGGSSGPATYAPVIEKSAHGKAEVKPRNPKQGDKVTVTLTPDKGYQIDGITVTDRKGNPVAVTDHGGGTYTFIQPNGRVTVSASFKADGGYDSCSKDHTCPVARFADTSPTAWYHDGVHYCLEHGLMGGYETGLFGPGDYLSRAHLVQMLYNRAGQPDVTEASGFEDVAPDAWYAKAVAWAQRSGIVSGYDERHFGPDNRITREQMVTILWQHAGSPAAAGLALDFTDADSVSGYAADALRWAVDRKIIYGKDGGILDPTGLATRAEAASVLMQYGTKITR